MSLKETKIEDASGKPHTYRVQLRSASEGVALLGRLSKFAPAGAVIAMALNGESSGSVADLNALIPTLASAFDEALILEVLKYTERDGERVAGCFNLAYSGNYGELSAAVVFALKSEFGSLGNLGKLLARSAG